ncbi:hypothetical protein LTR10_016142 [Elasticomyces elasticus]|uniref:Uncharacterized protein n=1 Tax=Exophiala sideris TaxID=1016849 RepID=A0ABR0JGP8_9EURO|nr:hypothetical protein LTR10_016142 [Elasticomyces elasticus]KAK5027588.1 hypothetical protein LTR13_009521 [Exophiala sideris]KAK5032850.1 hypothetical protein LTS07_004260 [Exophiala sideris]KAK5062374.1 hypothetical protein LTR69_004732 [Exophiala sideris]KAK5177532.1 hypothetical protein LTR44_009942 [Eurotiomycetes sp. CCFEE 6388]
MPTRHGFTVNVTTVDGVPYTEYGDQNIGTRNTSRMVSCKVRAIDGQKFHIRINPEYPYPYEGEAKTGLSQEKSDGGGHNDARYNLRQRKNALGDTFSKDRMELDPDRTKQSNSEEQPEYTFAYWVYIEGNEKPECGGILNVNNPRVKPQILKGRYSAPMGSRDAKVDIHEWQFTSRGIDVLLSNMDIAADTEAPDMLQQEVDEVTKALDTLTSTKTRRSPGQIEVRIVRIVITGTPTGGKSCWQRESNDRPAHDNNGTDYHPITVDRRPQYTMKLVPTNWKLYNDHETCYARFTFQGMDLPKLVRLNLATPDGKKQQRLNGSGNGLANLHASSGSPPKRRLKAYGPDEREEVNAKADEEKWSSDEDSNNSGDEDSSSEDEPRTRKRRGGNNNLAMEVLPKEAPRHTMRTPKDSKKSSTTETGLTMADSSYWHWLRAQEYHKNRKEDAGFSFQPEKPKAMPAEAEQGDVQLVKTTQDKADEAENGRGKLDLVKIDDGKIEDDEEIEDHGEDQVIW